MQIPTSDGLRRALRDLHATESAPLLLGCDLIHGELAGEIVEVEAYGGFDDPGSHAHRRQTPRNATMFADAGIAYVYFTYGNHWMLCISTRPPGEGSAILIRAARPTRGLDVMRQRRPKAKTDKGLLGGPGMICQAMEIDRRHDGLDLLDPSSSLRIVPVRPTPVALVSRRIGIAAGKGDDLPWRYVHPEHGGYASRPD